MTAVPYASFYAVLVGAVMLASPLQGAMVVGAYGLGRVVPVLAGSVVFALHGRVDVFLGRMLSGRARVKFIVGLASAAASGLMTAALVAH
jgi:sulfite exporter TauE/SafE